MFNCPPKERCEGLAWNFQVVVSFLAILVFDQPFRIGSEVLGVFCVLDNENRAVPFPSKTPFN